MKNEQRWEIFVQAYHGNFEPNTQAKTIADDFEKEMEISKSQKDMIQKIVSLLFRAGENKEELRPFLSFIFEREQQIEAEKVFDHIREGDEDIIIRTVVQAIRQRKIDKSTRHKIEEDDNRKGLICAIGLAYAANENKILFDESTRKMLFYKYADFFSDKSSIFRIGHLYKNMEHLSKFRHLINLSKENNVLSVALAIEMHFIFDLNDVPSLIEQTGKTYDLLREMFSAIKKEIGGALPCL